MLILQCINPGLELSVQEAIGSCLESYFSIIVLVCKMHNFELKTFL